MTGQTTRTPYAHKIRYGITGAPILTEDEMDGSHAPGVGVEPALIELVYRAALDGKPTSVDASVTGWWTRHGRRDQPESQVATHFKNGPDGWPAWLAEEARLHDPHAPAGQAPATDRAAVLTAAVAELEALRVKTDVNVAEYPRYDARQRSALDDGIRLLRRMADETQPKTQPRRGDAFEAWLKAQRDRYDRTDQREESSEFWHEFDSALDLYRLHADTGTPLGEHVCESRVVGDCECLEQPAVEAQQPKEA